MKTALFDFRLPEFLIAVRPADPRDASRLLVVDDSLRDASIRDLPSFLKPGDVMVMNDTRVIPARLLGKRGTASIEILLHQCHPERRPKAEVEGSHHDCIRSFGSHSLAQDDSFLWRCFAKPAKKLKIGDRIDFAPDFFAEVKEKLPDGQVVLHFDSDGFQEKLARYGHVPLPPYIERPDEEEDKECYQTVYAAREGSVAAPTAGLHFTESLLNAIDAVGVKRAHITLHVGGGTFLPVKAEDTQDHKMHSEWAEISAETAAAINGAKAKGGRVIAVGTTSLRTLESSADENGVIKPFSGETDIFIAPGYRFKAVDMLLTNFHLPRSTLFMLVSAFSGTERMKEAYAHAIAQQYRFYSYGDACLLYRT